MTSTLKSLADTKINLWVAFALSIVSSLATVAASQFVFGPRVSSDGTAPQLMTTGPSVLDCDVGVYSPVQKQCVSQDVFDAEMKRLFAALGIDTSIYEQEDTK